MIRRGARRTLEKTKKAVYVALFAALTAVLSQLSIPLPSGVPITAQTFAIAFAGFFLGAKYGVAAVAVYVALGAAGAPVFAGFTGGAYKLIGLTGGFVWGFFPFVFLCGAVRHPSFGVGKRALGERSRAGVAPVMSALAGLALCHLIGIAQYAALTGNGFIASALAVSAPYLAKDALSVLLAFMSVGSVARRMRAEAFGATGNININLS